MGKLQLNRLSNLVSESTLTEAEKQPILKTIEDLRRPLDKDVWVYRIVVFFLGVAIVLPFLLVLMSPGNPETLKLVLPISTGAIGGLIGLLAPSPMHSR